MGEFPHFPGRRDVSHPLTWLVSDLCLWPGSRARAGVGGVSGAVAADRPGPRSEPPGTAELLCALSYGSGLAAAERMEARDQHGLRGRPRSHDEKAAMAAAI